MKKSKSYTSAPEIVPLSIDKVFLDYFTREVCHGKTAFDLDIQKVISGNIDSFNIGALTSSIIKKREKAKARLEYEYMKNLAEASEMDTTLREVNRARLTAKIAQLEEQIRKYEEGEQK